MAVLLTACGGASSATDAGAPTTETSHGSGAVVPAPSTGQPASGGEPGEACDLLDDAEIEEHVGHPVLASESAFDGQCQWTLDDGGSNLPTIFVEVTAPGGRERWEILAGQMPAVDVAGGEAYQQGDSIVAVDGDTLLKLSWFSGTVDQMIPLTEAALGRIQP